MRVFLIAQTTSLADFVFVLQIYKPSHTVSRNYITYRLLIVVIIVITIVVVVVVVVVVVL